MALHQVTCPHCQTMSRSAKPIPPGIELTCPKCRTPFKVPAEAALAAVGLGARITAGGPGLGGSGAGASTAPAPSQALAPTQHDPATVEIPGRPDRRERLMVVAGASAGVLLVGGILLAVCFSGGSPDKTPPEGGNPDYTISEPVKKQGSAAKPLIELSPEDEAKVKAMVAKGMAYLKKTQNENGSWGSGGIKSKEDNYVAFAGLTLLYCGAPADDPAVQKAAKFAREQMPKINRTYVAALFLLFFDKLTEVSQKAKVLEADIPRDKEHIRTLALRLVAGQLPSGGWTYGVPILAEADASRLQTFLAEGSRSFKDAQRQGTVEEIRKSSEAVRKKLAEGQKTLPPGLRRTGVLHSPPADADPSVFGAGGDNSNTQFGILGLWAARRHGLPVENALELVARRFRATQNPNGGFPYSGHRHQGSPSMTCAGLLGLAVNYGIQEKRQAGAGPQHDEAIKKALAHLSSFVDPAKGKKAKKTRLPPLYFLWSVERVAVLYQLKQIQDKDWFGWGMAMLQEHHLADGSWHASDSEGGDHIPDTCFALLFLNRVNLATDLTDKLYEGQSAPGFASVADAPRKDP